MSMCKSRCKRACVSMSVSESVSVIESVSTGGVCVALPRVWFKPLPPQIIGGLQDCVFRSSCGLLLALVVGCCRLLLWVSAKFCSGLLSLIAGAPSMASKDQDHEERRPLTKGVPVGGSGSSGSSVSSGSRDLTKAGDDGYNSETLSI